MAPTAAAGGRRYRLRCPLRGRRPSSGSSIRLGNVGKIQLARLLVRLFRSGILPRAPCFYLVG